MGQLLDDALLDALAEESQVAPAVVEHGPEDVFQKRLGEVSVAVQIAEGSLGLDHPELRQVPRRVRVLRPERRPERVAVAERAAVRFDGELAGDGQVRPPGEEVLLPVDLAVGPTRRVLRVEYRDGEHLAGAFAVAGGDDRRVDVQEPAVLEEAVNRRADTVPHAGDGPEGVRPRPQVGLSPEELERVPLLLDGVTLGVGPAENAKLSDLHLDGLPLAL